MGRNKRATSDDFPISEPSAEPTTPDVWDPTGIITPAEPAPTDNAVPTEAPTTSNDDPELCEFLAAINASKDPDTEFILVAAGAMS